MNVKLCSQKCILEPSCLTDVWLGLKYASGSLGAPWKKVPLSNIILQYLCHNQFVFCFPKWKCYVEKPLIATFTRFILVNTFCITPLLNIGMFSIKIQGSANLIFLCIDFCTHKMDLHPRLYMQNYMFMKQLQWALVYII